MQRQLPRYRDLLRSSEEDEEHKEIVYRQWRYRERQVESRRRRVISSARPKYNEALQTGLPRTQIDITELYRLRTGDHIAWRRPCGYLHHAIVVDVDANNRMLKVIHYQKENHVAKIREQWIDAEKESGELFRLDYTEDVTDNNPIFLVLGRARSHLGEKGYHLFGNNCEHFATFCKTGVKESAQVNWALGKVKETLYTGACIMGKEIAKQGTKSLMEGTGKVAVAEAVEAVGRASNWVGAGLVAGFETVHCIYDIYQMNQHLKDRDFKVSATRRVSEGVASGACGIGGSILGGMALSFIPVVGTFVGSVVGGAAGSFVGKVLGSIFGNLFGNWLW